MGEPRAVIHRHMNTIPPCAPIASAMRDIDDTIAGTVEVSECLDVEMDQFPPAARPDSGERVSVTRV